MGVVSLETSFKQPSDDEFMMLFPCIQSKISNS